MKLIDNTLYIEWQQAIESGIPKGTMDAAKARKSPSWNFIDDPDDKRFVLVEFEKLSDNHKRKIEARFGNVYEYVAKQPIRKLVKWDDKAEEFFLAYRYDENKKLPIDTVKKYTVAANWLNMLKEVNNDKKRIKQLLNLTIEQFYDKVIEIIKAQDILDKITGLEKLLSSATSREAETINSQIAHLREVYKKERIDLPTSYRRLVVNQDSALKKYLRDGYASLISAHFGNKRAAKIADEVSESMLLELLSKGNQHDDVIIRMQYNKWADANGYKQIDAATVGVWRRKRAVELEMEREGNASLKNKFLRQAKGFRPSQPLYLVESDDNHIDLAFLDPDNSKASPRYIAVVVQDSFNDYPIGKAYAISGTLNEGQFIALVRAAYVDAMYYLRSITGQWILPHETKTDNFGIKSLRPFYDAIGKYVPTPVASKNRGYIENKFGTKHHWKRCLKLVSEKHGNYLGNNMTAKFRGVNQEMVAQRKKDRPLIGNEAYTQLESFFHLLRHIPQSNGISKHQQWMEAFTALPDTEKRIITDEQFLLKFGIEHNPDRPIRITNRGIEPQINGVKYTYDLEGGSWIEHIGKSVTVFYDPFDMSRVLITDGGNLRMIAREARLNPRALKDTFTDSRTYLNSILTERREDVERLAAKSERRKQVLVSAGFDAETVLQEGVIVKELKLNAERDFTSRLIDGGASSDDFYDQM